MRVNIEHKEVTIGWFRKQRWIAVRVKVDFSYEEQAIIKENDIGGVIVLQREPDFRLADIMTDPREHYLRIEHLTRNNPNTYNVRSAAEAKMYEREVIEALKELKTYLQVNASRPSSGSFEI